MATQSFRRILELRERHGVEYVLVGDVAAVLQGVPVTTFDLDALFHVEPANVDRLAKALAQPDARYRERRDVRPTVGDLAAGGHLLLMTDCGPFDVLGFIGGGKRYEDVVPDALTMSIGEVSLKVLSLPALI
jgi:hypothetical protein